MKQLLDAANAVLQAHDAQSGVAACALLDGVIEHAYHQMSRAYRDVAPHCWRRLFTDACILRTLAGLVVPEPSLTAASLKAAVARLDRAIIIAGACGERRSELIQNLIVEIQEMIPHDDVPPGADLPPSPPDRQIDMPDTFAAPVDRLTAPPSFSTFISKARCRPFVLPGFLREWPALTDRPWRSLEYLRKVAGPGRVVPIEVGSDYRSDEWTQRMMDMDEFLDSLSAFAHGNANGSPVLYLAQHSIFM